MNIGVDISIYNDSTRSRVPVSKMRRAVENVLRGEVSEIQASVTIVLVNDEKIHNLNREFLQHDYPTDVITFPLADREDEIDGEIYISIDTAEQQAKEYGVSLTNELTRLAAHGALHLVGYDDATSEQRATMKTLEDRYMTA
jgi:rRNA maturation RNase YbeY